MSKQRDDCTKTSTMGNSEVIALHQETRTPRASLPRLIHTHVPSTGQRIIDVAAYYTKYWRGQRHVTSIKWQFVTWALFTCAFFLWGFLRIDNERGDIFQLVTTHRAASQVLAVCWSKWVAIFKMTTHTRTMTTMTSPRWQLPDKCQTKNSKCLTSLISMYMYLH